MAQRMPTAKLGALKYLVGGVLDPGWLLPWTRCLQNPQFLLPCSLLIQMKRRPVRGHRQTNTCPLMASWFGSPKMFLVMASSNVAAPALMLICLGKERSSNWWQLDDLLKSPACCGKVHVGDFAVVFCFLPGCRFFGSGSLGVGSPKHQVCVF